MTTFKKQMKSDALNTLLNNDELGESIVYTPSGGTAREIQAVINRDAHMVEWDETRRGTVYRADLEISTDADRGYATPATGDKVTFDNRDWFIREIQPEPIQGMSLITAERFITDRHGSDTQALIRRGA